MCVPLVGPQGIISQHPACHRLQQGSRTGEVTWGWMGGGRSLVGLINQEEKVLPFGNREDILVDTVGSEEEYCTLISRALCAQYLCLEIFCSGS